MLGKNWWVILFCGICALTHFHVLKEKKYNCQALQDRLSEMLHEKRVAVDVQIELKERIIAQSDPAWIEMILMRDLGVVPEGFLKVHFSK